MSSEKDTKIESESSDLEEEKDKPGDIISSSSEEENHDNKQLNNSKNVDSNQKILGNKRPPPNKESKERKDYNEQRKKLKKYDNNINNISTNNYFMPSLDIPLVSYEVFCELINEKEKNKNLQENELKKMYEDYKTEHEQKNTEQFYNNHSKDEWFKEKYEPKKFVEFNINERREMCQKKAKIFFNKYDFSEITGTKEIIDINENKKMDEDGKNLAQNFNYIFELKQEHEFSKKVKIVYTKLNPINNNIEEIERNLNDIPYEKDIIQKDLDDDGKPYYFYNQDYLTIFNSTALPRDIDILKIINLFKKYDGYVSFSITEPDKGNGYRRNFWVSYDKDENIETVLKSLDGYKLDDKFEIKIQKSETDKRPYNKKIKITQPLFDERLNEDIIGSYKIIQILDKDKEIINNPLVENLNIDNLQNMKDDIKTKILNFNLFYLRTVHGFCYYCLRGYKDERNLSKKCDFLHLRHYNHLGPRGGENKNLSEEELKNAIEFDKYFTQKLNELLDDQNKINIYLLQRPKYIFSDENFKEKAQNEMQKFIEENSNEYDKDKFECILCPKKFCSYKFIENHIKNKHYKEMEDKANESANQILMKENFIEDKEKFNKNNIISNMDKYDEYVNNYDSKKIGIKKYKDWDDPMNFLSNKTQYMKISYDDL